MLEPLAVSDACVAIGEAGFDLYYEHSPRDEQETAFRWQIRLAKRLDKPLVIHSRDAWDDTFRVLDDEGVPERTIFHCFTGGPDEARGRARPRAATCRSAGSCRSRTPTTCATRRASTTADRLLVETDSPVPRARAAPREAERAGVRRRGRRGAGAGAERGCRRRRRARRARTRRACSASSGDARRRSARCSTRTGSDRARRWVNTSSPTRTPRRHIVRLAGVEPGDRVVEVGPGIGSLTLALADAGAHVLAIELDRHLLPALREVVAGRDVEIVHADAMKRRLDASCSTAGGAWSRTFRTTSRRRWSLQALETAPMIERFLVMVQREAGERLAANVGDVGFGAVSVKVAYYADGEVRRQRPAQRVRAEAECRQRAWCELVRREQPPVSVSDPDRMFALVRAGFATRRKMLRRALVGNRRRRRVRSCRRRSDGARRDADARRLGAADRGGGVIRVDATAKVTLSLRVVGRRPDGYHDSTR